jgi:formylglycine-generating enzyme required for sulfatase activity
VVLRSALVSTALGATVACRTPPPPAGILVRFAATSALVPDALDVEIRWGASRSWTHHYAPLTLPATLAVVSDGAEVSVEIDASVSARGMRLDEREISVSGVPQNRVVELDVVFDGACAAGVGASPVASCATSGACRVQCDGTGLPAVEPDASTAAQSPPADGGGEGGDLPPDATGGNDAAPELEAGASSCGCEAGTHCVSGGCVSLPPSCLGASLGADLRCGADGAHDCCGAHDLPAGSFLESYDGVAALDGTHPASVSAFRLDDDEVTVGRFRQFVAAVVNQPAWLPPAGSGKHLQVSGGMGLASAADGGPSLESGWDPAWNAAIPTSAAAWSNALTSCGGLTSSYLGGGTDRRPINCVTWYEAYAFCIWDGGFLPTEAEWNYAAAGGDEQRVYPWGAPDPGPDARLAVYGCYYADQGPGTCRGLQDIAPVGTAGGVGRWGQIDLAGSLWEWCLDAYAPLGPACTDCAALQGGSARVIRGGAYDTASPYLRTAVRNSNDPSYRSDAVGLRCARVP